MELVLKEKAFFNNGELLEIKFHLVDSGGNLAGEASLYRDREGALALGATRWEMIRGVMITGVPKLNAIDAAESTTRHPFIQVDWSQLRPFCLEGIAPYETTETGGSNQPMTVTRAKYMTWNLRAWNCKTMALYTQGA